MAIEKLRKRIAGNRIYATVAEKDRNLDNIVMADKADKVASATNNHFAALDASGNLKDSSKSASDFATAAQGTLASTAVHDVKIGNTSLKDGSNVATIPDMTGATASDTGSSGLVPAPAVADKDKFLKGDGTWDAPPSVNLGPYYYDVDNTGLSAKRTSGSEQMYYRQASLVGCSGNANNYDVNMTFSLNWSHAVEKLISIDTTNESKSYLSFGLKQNESVYNTSARRYLLPRPVANRVAMTDSSSNIVWGTVPQFAPAPTVDNSLLLGQSDGSKAWASIARDAFGTPLLGENGLPVLDEGENPVFDAGSTTDLWTSFDGHGFGAIRTYADQDGNNIKTTYATKTELDGVAAGLEDALDALNDTMETVAHAGMYDLGHKDESNLETGNILAISCGNSNTELALTTVSTLTVLANPGVANFALLVDNTENSNDVTVTVKNSTDTDTFLYSSAAGNQVKKNTICQITCVGRCWTLAEFEAPA